MKKRLFQTIAQAIAQEQKKFLLHWHWYLVGVILFVVLPTYNYYYLDGVTHNRVLTFNDPVDPSALRTDKDEYCPGETIYVEQNFCKNRHVEGYEVEYWMSNGNLVPVEKRSTDAEGQELPIGCYPSDEEGVILSRIHDVPEGTTEGFHQSVGLTKHLLSGDRIREQEYQTIPYYVKSAEACAIEAEIEQLAEHERRVEAGLNLPDVLQVNLKE